MARTIEIKKVAKADGLITVELKSGKSSTASYPPDANALERLQDKVDEIAIDVISLVAVQLGDDLTPLEGATFTGDFDTPAAMLRLELKQ